MVGKLNNANRGGGNSLGEGEKEVEDQEEGEENQGCEEELRGSGGWVGEEAGVVLGEDGEVCSCDYCQ